MSTQSNITHESESVKLASEVIPGDVVWDRDEGFLVNAARTIHTRNGERVLLQSKRGDYWELRKDRHVTILPNLEALRECLERVSEDY